MMRSTPLAGVDVFLDGDFVGRVFLEEAAHADVKAFSVFRGRR